MAESLKKQAVSGILWSAVERFSVQGVLFLIMIIMARILSPKDYGLVGMLAVFIAVSQSLIDSGFSQALIRKQNRTDIDNSTVFYFNIVVGFALYGLLYIAAPFVAQFYHTPELTSLMRVICISIIFNSFAVVQRALLTIKVDFRTQAKATFSAAVLSGIVGISMAYSGFGVWSIVAQQLTNLGTNTIFLWIFAKWIPIKSFSWNSFKELFSFGSKLLFSGLLDTLYKNIYLIVIGKVFTASNLGYYTKAHELAVLPSSNLTGILQRVTYPILCKIQNDDDHLSLVYRRFLRVSAFIIFPLMMGISALSTPIILLLLKEQWLFSATLLKILCLSGMWYPIHSINLNLLQVKGRSDLFLRLEVIKKIIYVIILIITIPIGLIAMCIGQILSSLICLGINTYYTGKLIDVGFIRQMKDLLPTLILSIAMWLIVFFIQSLMDSSVQKLVVGTISGIIFYTFSAYLLRFRELKEVLSIIRINKY